MCAEEEKEVKGGVGAFVSAIECVSVLLRNNTTDDEEKTRIHLTSSLSPTRILFFSPAPSYHMIENNKGVFINIDEPGSEDVTFAFRYMTLEIDESREEEEMREMNRREGERKESVFMFALIVVEVLMREAPMREEVEAIVHKRIQKGELPSIKKEAESEEIGGVVKMLMKEWKKRQV